MEEMMAEPVRIVLESRVRPGAQMRFEQRLQKLMALASRDSGLQGSSVLTAGSSGEYFILLPFASQSDLDTWQSSDGVRALLAEAEPLAVAAEQAQEEPLAPEATSGRDETKGRWQQRQPATDVQS